MTVVPPHPPVVRNMPQTEPLHKLCGTEPQLSKAQSPHTCVLALLRPCGTQATLPEELAGACSGSGCNAVLCEPQPPSQAVPQRVEGAVAER